MKISKGDFVGTGKVFRFTLSQYVKNKANIITFIILILVCALSAPLSTLMADTPVHGPVGPDTLYIDNQSSLDIYCPEETLLSYGFTDTKVKALIGNSVGERDAVLSFFGNEEELSCEIVMAEDSYLEKSDIDILRSLCQRVILDSKCHALGIDPAALATMGNVPQIDVLDENQTDDHEDGSWFILQYVYSLPVMMLTLLAASYIIRSVIEEKSSKLVDLLMVSVKPLALLAGKILAMMLAVLVTILSMIGTVVLSNYISVTYLDAPGLWQMFASFDVDLSHLNFGVETILLTVLSVFLAYLTYSLLAGIAGSCCSAMEQADSASALVTMTVMAGYLVSCVTSNFSSAGVAYFTSLCPVISTFCAPVQYAAGNIPLWVFLTSILLQGSIAYLLIRFCAKVYHSLIIHRGNRVKWRDLFQMAKEDGRK